MSYAYTLKATVRKDNGKGASRRLRNQGLVPAIVYGGNEAPLSIALDQNDLVKFGKNDSFYSQIINLEIEGQGSQEVILRAVQRHLFKPLYQHIDMQRVVKGQELHATISLHFVNEANCKGVKESGAIVEHKMSSIEVFAAPANLPTAIEVDMSEYEVNASVHLRDLKLPAGVRLAYTDERADAVVAQVIYPQDSEA